MTLPRAPLVEMKVKSDALSCRWRLSLPPAGSWELGSGCARSPLPQGSAWSPAPLMASCGVHTARKDVGEG